MSVWPNWNTSHITPEVLEEVHNETRSPKAPVEMTMVAGVDENQQDTASLFTLEDKKCSLKKLLHVSRGRSRAGKVTNSCLLPTCV